MPHDIILNLAGDLFTVLLLEILYFDKEDEVESGIWYFQTQPLMDELKNGGFVFYVCVALASFASC
jgi:hypothetical protein